ncbi:P-loop containing nucleoside triphosphate hydrolase protein, partial [Acaromyces ingoldii]
MTSSGGLDAGRVVVVGVGGATNSGKTTLAKRLLSMLPAGRGIMVHQDDFALPESELPWNEKAQARDWDHPVGTIDYERLDRTVQYIEAHRSLPPDHASHDHLNASSTAPPLSPASRGDGGPLASRLAALLAADDGLTLAILDGFLLYFSPRVHAHIDVRLFLRVPRHTLEERRHRREGYATAEGTVWQDPPGYFDDVVWPAYVLAHEQMFSGQDVECGDVVKVDKDSNEQGAPISNLILLEAD